MSKGLQKIFQDAHAKEGNKAVLNADLIDFETRIAREGHITKAEKREKQKFSCRANKMARQATKNRKKWQRLQRRFG